MTKKLTKILALLLAVLLLAGCDMIKEAKLVGISFGDE